LGSNSPYTNVGGGSFNIYKFCNIFVSQKIAFPPHAQHHHKHIGRLDSKPLLPAELIKSLPTALHIISQPIPSSIAFKNRNVQANNTHTMRTAPASRAQHHHKHIRSLEPKPLLTELIVLGQFLKVHPFPHPIYNPHPQSALGFFLFTRLHSPIRLNRPGTGGLG
jgi:hypothetical protein